MSNKQHRILIMGAGKIGVTVASLLAASGDYKAYIADLQPPSFLPKIEKSALEFITMNIKNQTEAADLIKHHGIEGIVSCLPFHLSLDVAKLAKACGIHYFDATEDVAITTAVTNLAQGSKGVFAPQCGLAPGFISIAANSLIETFDEVDHLKMRVGALTQSTSNSLHYGFTWSIDGLINEYLHPCLVLENGEQKLTPALGGLEELIINGLSYEAFHTSGGVGSLVETHQGRVKNMDYKTIRYIGHCQNMRFLLHDLKLGEKPALVKEILENAIPHVEQDKVVVYVAAQGLKDGRLIEKSYTNILYPANISGHTYTAIQMTTASGICTVVDKVMHEKAFTGLLKQEQISLDSFLANRFGSYYAHTKECFYV